MQVQGLRSFVDLAIIASTEECYPKVLPHMAVGGHCVLIHDPTVGAESDLLPLIGVIRDGDLTQALRFVELENHVFSLILKLHSGENNHD